MDSVQRVTTSVFPRRHPSTLLTFCHNENLIITWGVPSPSVLCSGSYLFLKPQPGLQVLFFFFLIYWFFYSEEGRGVKS